MFYQEASPKFWFVTHADSLVTTKDTHWGNLAAMFRKTESANKIPICTVTVAFMWVAYFCMGACKLAMRLL